MLGRVTEGWVAPKIARLLSVPTLGTRFDTGWRLCPAGISITEHDFRGWLEAVGFGARSAAVLVRVAEKRGDTAAVAVCWRFSVGRFTATDFRR